MTFPETARRPPTVANLNLSISGMTCASCAVRVERALNAVPSIHTANVNRATERADISCASPPVV